MLKLTDRILTIISEIKAFNLGHCSPSDDPDMQTAYLYAYKELSKRFIALLKRIDNQHLRSMVDSINTNPDSITEAYDLNADIFCIIDYVEDYIDILEFNEKKEISPEIASKLSKEIIECLWSESANDLPFICVNYGLAEGTTTEAFESKKRYVKKRISAYSGGQVYELAKKLEGKYPDSKLDNLLGAIDDFDNVSIDSKFVEIKQLIMANIENAKYLIWVAVAWFTDRDLANALYKKSKQGLNIQIILNNDDINNALIPKLSQYFEVTKIPSGHASRLMHHKFCVIDLKKVLHGSFNWTIRANFNNETISLIENRETAEKFAGEYLAIKQSISKIL